MTFWNTVWAVIIGLGIYSVIDFAATEVAHWIEDKRASKRFEEALTELEAYWAAQEAKAKPVRKKAAPKKK